MSDEEMQAAFSQLWALAYRISMLPLAPMVLNASDRAMRGEEYEDDAVADLMLLRAVGDVIKAISGKGRKSAPQGEVDLFAVINREGAVVIKKSIEDARETKNEIERWHFNPHPEAKIYRLVGTVVE